MILNGFCHAHDCGCTLTDWVPCSQNAARNLLHRYVEPQVCIVLECYQAHLLIHCMKMFCKTTVVCIVLGCFQANILIHCKKMLCKKKLLYHGFSHHKVDVALGSLWKSSSNSKLKVAVMEFLGVAEWNAAFFANWRCTHRQSRSRKATGIARTEWCL